MVFDKIKETFVNESREHEELEKLEEEKARLAEEERAESLAQMGAAQAKAIADLDRNSPVEDWPDFIDKHKKIVEKSASDPSWKFNDNHFDANKDEQKVLGDRVFNEKGPRNIEKWQRASELGYELFVDGISCGDIVQGALGDCYLLSALAVMSKDSIEDMFESEKEGDKHNNWKKTGHFAIRFTKEGAD